jgi:hypothetical protein
MENTLTIASCASADTDDGVYGRLNSTCEATLYKYAIRADRKPCSFDGLENDFVGEECLTWYWR